MVGGVAQWLGRRSYSAALGTFAIHTR